MGRSDRTVDLFEGVIGGMQSFAKCNYLVIVMLWGSKEVAYIHNWGKSIRGQKKTGKSAQW